MLRSPLAPERTPDLPPIAGIRMAAVNAGIKYPDKPEVLLAVCEEGTTCAGALTTSLTASAAVEHCRKSLAQSKGRVLVVNSGNANAFTGREGEAVVVAIKDAAAKFAGCIPDEVLTASTGVIGELLPAKKITGALSSLAKNLRTDAWEEATRAIMTTDTFMKMATRKAGGVTINGIAKGSGMIAPDMATMLAFIFTDAEIPAHELQAMLEVANAQSFNCITVDGDTSTSDTCLIFATGKAGKPEPKAFQAALTSLMTELAQLVVKDGEGATKFITVTVSGAHHDDAAKKIAMTIANSPLVKTAIAGEDANWGRIVAAVGRAGEKAERDRLAIHIGGVLVAEKGAAAADYHEAKIADHMKSNAIDIRVDVGVGSSKATVWTCDLTQGYIDINGSYRS